MQTEEQDRSGRPDSPRTESATVLSRQLFSDGPVLRIVHGEEVYILRRTRSDKLILTK